MAVANYESTYGTMPPAYVRGPDGRPWHSWRVLVLPFLEQKDVYDAYRFDEPWNGPNNRLLAGRVARTFQRPEDPSTSGHTRFLAVVGDPTAFPGDRALASADLKDGTSKTLLFVEVQGLDIPWMAPTDLEFDRLDFHVTAPGAKGIGSPYGGARVAFADGAIDSLDEQTPPDVLRALLTADGGDPVHRDEDRVWTLAP